MTIECAYGVLFGLHWLGRPEYGPNEGTFDFIGESHVRLTSILTRGWRVTPKLQHMTGRLSAQFDYGQERGQLLMALRSGAYTWIRGSALSVQAIHMSSPGSISFTGLGEPIRQLRLLIKDLWYRNRQEKEKGLLAIELMRRQLDQLEFPGSVREAGSIDGATMLMTHAVGDLVEMEDRGLVVDIPAHVDPPEEGT